MSDNGGPLPIFIQNTTTRDFELDEEALASVLLAPDVKDKPVCLLAVAGAFRKGKTFLLSFLLRYCANRGSEDWLGDPSCPLEGFKWRYGSERETTGVLIWSKPFIVKKQSGEEVAVILMDTQGTFDTESTLKDSTVVFAFSTMVSSVLVYNLMGNIQEDDLMNLQTFTSYASLSQENGDTSHPFQNLHFLVRDWGFPDEKPYGQAGGQSLLARTLTKAHPSAAHQELRRDLRNCFKNINCYLMPSPGSEIVRSKNFDGRIEDIDKKFVYHLRSFVPLLLAPENLVEKIIDGQLCTAQTLFNLCKTCVEVFKENDLPDHTTLVEVAARTSSQTALDAAKELYSEAMGSLTGRDRPSLELHQMKAEQEKAKERAVASYLEKNKYAKLNRKVTRHYQAELEKEIDKSFVKYIERNEENKRAESDARRVAEERKEAEQVAARFSCQTAQEAAKVLYKEAMDSLTGRNLPSLKVDKMQAEHEKEKERAVACYLESNKCTEMHQNVAEQFKTDLEKEIDQLYVKYMEQNEAKKEAEAEREAEAKRKAEAKREADALKETMAKNKAQAEKDAADLREAVAKSEAEAKKQAEARKEADAKRAAEAVKEAEARKEAEVLKERLARMEARGAGPSGVFGVVGSALDGLIFGRR